MICLKAMAMSSVGSVKGWIYQILESAEKSVCFQQGYPIYIYLCQSGTAGHAGAFVQLLKKES